MIFSIETVIREKLATRRLMILTYRYWLTQIGTVDQNPYPLIIVVYVYVYFPQKLCWYINYQRYSDDATCKEATWCSLFVSLLIFFYDLRFLFRLL